MEQGFHILVTAGPTRTPIDEVRYWANIFTGNTGLQIALTMRDLGHVTLLTSNPDHLARLGPDGADHDPRLTVMPFVTFNDLDLALAQTVRRQPFTAVFMTAAVSDYQSAGAYLSKAAAPFLVPTLRAANGLCVIFKSRKSLPTMPTLPLPVRGRPNL